MNLCELLPGARKAVKAWVAWRCCATVLPDHFAPCRPCRFENGSRAAQDWYVVSCASPQCHGECSTLRRQPSCPEAVSWRQHWASQMYLHIYIYISSFHSHPKTLQEEPVSRLLDCSRHPLMIHPLICTPSRLNRPQHRSEARKVAETSRATRARALGCGKAGSAATCQQRRTPSYRTRGSAPADR